MRAVRNTEKGIEVVDTDPSGVGVRVRVTGSGICGSDVKMAGFGPLPVTLGHEFAGRLDDGTPVTVRPIVPCGQCENCRRGREEQCPDVLAAIYGVSLDGGMADEAWVDAGSVVPLPPGLEPADAVLSEPLAVAVHCLNQAGVTAGQQVLVIGAGAIGLCAIAAATALGASVDVEARHAGRRAAAERLGAKPAGPATDFYDVVIDAAGTQEAVALAVARAARGAVLGVASTWWTPVGLDTDFQVKQLKIVPALLYGHHHGEDEFEAAVALLARTPDLADAVITHRFGLDDAAEAFRVAGDHASGAIKVVVEP
jgi:threonine dehydrogenase-like Zn-dependent dehydrogenase